MDINDNEHFINGIRKDLGIEKRTKEDTFCSFEDLDYNILKDVFSSNENCINNKNNIYLKCTLNKNEIVEGLEKTIIFKRTLENNKTEKAKLNIKIPSNIQNGQSIIIYGEGNRTNELIGNLIVKIEI